MINNKPAPTHLEIHELIKNRWSPRSFANKDINNEDIQRILEAGRWAPSSGNEQNWKFVYAHRADEKSFEELYKLLSPGNAIWCKQAGVLMISLARTTFEKNNEPNYYALHDVGLATENILLQASAMDIYAHPMAGFDKKRTTTLLNLPDNVVPVAMIAFGHPAPADQLDEPFKSRETAPRERKALSEISSLFKAP